MSHAHLTRIRLSHFKSYGSEPVTVDLRPITLLVGRNNSGKSSIIQALLLLKQTLEQARGNEPLVLHGNVPVPAGDLRELTHGWPTEPGYVGPMIEVEWQSRASMNEALGSGGWPNREELAKQSGIPWVVDTLVTVELTTTLKLRYRGGEGRVTLIEAALTSERRGGGPPVRNPSLVVTPLPEGRASVLWNGAAGRAGLHVEWDHFLPFISIDRRNVGPRSNVRGQAGGFLILYDQPLADLKQLLEAFAYLSSARPTPQPIYQPVGGELTDVGFAGERAAQVLHARKSDLFHYLPPLEWEEEARPRVGQTVRQRDLATGIQEVFASLGVQGSFSTTEVANIGFTMLFGRSSLFHVGRGISYLLPLVELALLGDPAATQDLGGDVSLETYLAGIQHVRHIAIEEPESHLNPAIHSRLAHLLVAAAMSGRQWLIETHSDHMVRRLRRLAAAAPADSELERWLCENVAVVEVSQASGRTTARTVRLTPDGAGSSDWPDDFMDQALQEEDAIYLDRLAKQPVGRAPAGMEVVHGDPAEDDGG